MTEGTLLQRLCDARQKPMLVFMGDGQSGEDFGRAAKKVKDALGDSGSFESLDLIVHQWGVGGAEAAPTVINVLQAASEELVAIVPYRAAGLAGVLALTCEKLIMGDIGHFGPMRAETLQERRKAVPGSSSRSDDRLVYPDDAVHAISDFGADFASFALSALADIEKSVPRDEVPGLAMRLAHLLTEPLLSSITAEECAAGLLDQQATFQSLDTALRKCRVPRKQIGEAVHALTYQQLQIFDRTWLSEHGIQASPVPESLSGLMAEFVEQRDEVRSEAGIVSLYLPRGSDAAPVAKAPRRTQVSKTKKPRKATSPPGMR